MHKVFYHIMVNVSDPTSGHETDVIHIELHLFYRLPRGIQINLGAFMLKYMMLCKEDSTKGLAYGKINQDFWQKWSAY